MKSIIALSVAFVVLLGASIGFYIWYFDDSSNTYVYDYKKNNSYQSYSSSTNQYNHEENYLSHNTYENHTQTNEEKPYESQANSLANNTIASEPNTTNVNIQKENTTTQKESVNTQDNNTSAQEKNTTTEVKKEKTQSHAQIIQTKTTQTIQNKNTQDVKQTHKKTNTYKNTMQEYIAKGKTSRYEPQLSNDFVKVYVLDGKNLSDYRIGVLKEMINPIENNSQDYNLTIFIDMLSNDNMKLSIYNKDIVFEKNKKKYNYVDVKISNLKFLFDKNGYSEYSNEDLLEKINQNLAREDIIKKVKIQGYADDRGSTFANYMIGLNRAMNVAKHFFSFTEVIEIESLGKDTYPTKDKSDSQRQNNRKVEISFYN